MLWIVSNLGVILSALLMVGVIVWAAVAMMRSGPSTDIDIDREIYDTAQTVQRRHVERRGRPNTEIQRRITQHPRQLKIVQGGKPAH